MSLASIVQLAQISAPIVAVVAAVPSLIAVVVLYLVFRPRAVPRATATGPGQAAQGPVPTFHVVALGASGSGMTVLLSAMFHELNHVTRTRSFALDTDPRDRLLLANIHQEVSDSSRPWPRATGRSLEETKQFVFDCVGRDDQGKRRVVARVSYLDFAHVLLEDATHADSESFRRLHEAIENASALLVLIDGRRVRQLMGNQAAGRNHFAHTMGPLLGLAQQAECPMHFVITKWDLLQDLPALRALDEPTRLDRVVTALMRHPQIEALVYAAGPGQIVRMIPVSSVGLAFVELDAHGRVLKRPDGELHPTNVDAPLAAVIPDVFRQVEAELDTQTRRSLHAELREGLSGGGTGLAARFAALLNGPTGIAVQTVLRGYLDPLGDGVSALFVDWAALRQTIAVAGAEQFREERDRELAALRMLRTRVLDDFARAVHRLEDRYPASLLCSPNRRWPSG